MAACSQIRKDAEQNGHAFAVRVEGLFKTLAVEGKVKPEPSSLALALAEVG